MANTPLRLQNGVQGVPGDKPYKDRRATERYKTNYPVTLIVSEKRHQVIMRDISVYGIGISAGGTEGDLILQKHHPVSIEWCSGESIQASVVWSFKGRHGLLLRPALDGRHPLIMKAKAQLEDTSD